MSGDGEWYLMPEDVKPGEEPLVMEPAGAGRVRVYRWPSTTCDNLPPRIQYGDGPGARVDFVAVPGEPGMYAVEWR